MPTKIVGGVTVNKETSLQDLVTGIHTEIGANNVEHALKGFHILNAADTSVANTAYHTIQFVQDSEITLTNNVGGDNITSTTFTAGTILYGAFTDITVNSGSLLCYVLGTYED